jgi:hypothetical protein
LGFWNTAWDFEPKKNAREPVRLRVLTRRRFGLVAQSSGVCREAVRINTQARLRSLRICLLVLTGLALTAIFPAGALPGYDGTGRLGGAARRRSGDIG